MNISGWQVLLTRWVIPIFKMSPNLEDRVLGPVLSASECQNFDAKHVLSLVRIVTPLHALVPRKSAKPELRIELPDSVLPPKKRPGRSSNQPRVRRGTRRKKQDSSDT